MAVDLSKINRPARAAARAEHVEPRRGGGAAGIDGRWISSLMPRSVAILPPRGPRTHVEVARYGRTAPRAGHFFAWGKTVKSAIGIALLALSIGPAAAQQYGWRQSSERAYGTGSNPNSHWRTAFPAG
jgi:hypothetical protein